MNNPAPPQAFPPRKLLLIASWPSPQAIDYISLAEHEAIIEQAAKITKTINEWRLEVKAENAKLREALQVIADKETCEKLYPGETKYKSYEEAWEGVAQFACDTLAPQLVCEK